MINIRKADVVTAIILNNNGEALLQKKDLSYPWFPGKWCLFGGHIEKGENPRAALQRELYEELEYKFDRINYYKEEEYEDTCSLGKRKGKMRIYVSKADIPLSKFSLKEGAGLAYLAQSELDHYPIVEHDLKILKEYFKTL